LVLQAQQHCYFFWQCGSFHNSVSLASFVGDDSIFKSIF
jgi:hypothetical protein